VPRASVLEAALGAAESEFQKYVISQIATIASSARDEHGNEVNLKDAGEFIERVGKVVGDVTKADKPKVGK